VIPAQASANLLKLFFLYFQDAYNNLKKILANKWEFVMMQADEQVEMSSQFIFTIFI
jgi:hypothetical protein